MLERNVVAAILLATSDRVDWMRNPVGLAVTDGRHIRYGCGGPGGSDLVGVVRSTGRAIFCEVKSATGRVRPEQQLFLDRMRASGAIAIVARSVADVLEALR